MSQDVRLYPHSRLSLENVVLQKGRRSRLFRNQYAIDEAQLDWILINNGSLGSQTITKSIMRI